MKLIVTGVCILVIILLWLRDTAPDATPNYIQHTLSVNGHDQQISLPKDFTTIEYLKNHPVEITRGSYDEEVTSVTYDGVEIPFIVRPNKYK